MDNSLLLDKADTGIKFVTLWYSATYIRMQCMNINHNVTPLDDPRVLESPPAEANWIINIGVIKSYFRARQYAKSIKTTEEKKLKLFPNSNKLFLDSPFLSSLK